MESNRPDRPDRPDWVNKYIEYRADITESYTDLALAKLLGIHKQTIAQYKQSHPELEEIIGQKLERQMNKVRNRAYQALFNRIAKSDKALQLALEITGIYTPKTEQTTTLKSMDADAKRRHIKALVNSMLSNKADDLGAGLSTDSAEIADNTTSDND